MTNTQKEQNRVFDFRMDSQSWFMIVAMVLAFAFVLLRANFGLAANEINTFTYLGFGALLTFVLITISCIPIVILCWFIKRIPDIDYAVWLSTVLVIISVFTIIFTYN